MIAFFAQTYLLNRLLKSKNVLKSKHTKSSRQIIHGFIRALWINEKLCTWFALILIDRQNHLNFHKALNLIENMPILFITKKGRAKYKMLYHYELPFLCERVCIPVPKGIVDIFMTMPKPAIAWKRKSIVPLLRYVLYSNCFKLQISIYSLLQKKRFYSALQEY